MVVIFSNLFSIFTEDFFLLNLNKTSSVTPKNEPAKILCQLKPSFFSSLEIGNKVTFFNICPVSSNPSITKFCFSGSFGFIELILNSFVFRVLYFSSFKLKKVKSSILTAISPSFLGTMR